MIDIDLTSGPNQASIPSLWRAQFIQVFEQIQNTRMRGMPIINPLLTTNASDFILWQHYSLGVLITPWFMSIVLVDTAETSMRNEQKPFGSKLTHTFPSGPYEFTQAYEDQIGHYQSCSLFSPMDAFSDQQAAEETARAALQALFTADEENCGTSSTATPSKPSKPMSRRTLLTGHFS